MLDILGFIICRVYKMNRIAGTQTEKNLVYAYTGSMGERKQESLGAEEARRQGFDQLASLFLKRMYDSFAETAVAEGLPEIAEKFRLLSEIERFHNGNSQALLKSLVLSDVRFESCS